jgi:hypothetical protein
LSSRFLYRKIRPEKRLCSYYRCQMSILRNIARTKDGRLWHWGCLETALDEQYRCLDCYGTFDATEVVLEEKQKFVGDSQKTLFSLACPNCGSHNMRRAARHHSMPSGEMVTCK